MHQKERNTKACNSNSRESADSNAHSYAVVDVRYS
jgi:hypothetical protein